MGHPPNAGRSIHKTEGVGYLDSFWGTPSWILCSARAYPLSVLFQVVYDLRAGSKRPPMALGKQLISWLGDQTPEGDRGEIVSAVPAGGRCSCL